MAFIKKTKYQKNGLFSVAIMKSEKAYTKYFQSEKNLETRLVLKRENCKAELRKFFHENMKELSNAGLNIIYLTDEGLQFSLFRTNLVSKFFSD